MVNQPQVMKAPADVKVEIYAPIHKAHRYTLFKIASETGRADYTDKQTISNILNQFTALTANIKTHAAWEEKAVHLLLTKKVPGAKEKIEAEHKTIHANLDLLVSYLSGILELPLDDQNLGRLLQEFYLAFNRFLPIYLEHIGYEEEQVEPLLWHLCSNQELMSTLVSFTGPGASPDLVRQNIDLIVPANNLDDLSKIIGMMKANAPPQVLQLWLSGAERNLSHEDYSKLKTRLEL